MSNDHVHAAAATALGVLRSEIRGLRSYHLTRHKVPVRLDQNENTLGLPEVVRQAVWDSLAGHEMNRYPELVPIELQEEIGRLNNWPAEGVLIGNGSNELLLMLALSTLERGRQAVAPTPSFSSFAFVTRLMGAELVEIPPDGEMAHPPAHYIDAIEKAQPALVFLCSPNNPTGAALTVSEIEEVAKICPGLIVVDEAYVEFAGGSAREILSHHSHMVLLRTFSKAAGLAGFRVGYAMTHPELASEVRKAQVPYAVNSYSRAAALAICRHYDLICARARTLAEARDKLHVRLTEIGGIRPYPSSTNFILFDCEPGAGAVFAGLLSRGVLVRDLSSHPLLPRALRVSVGNPEENRAFMSALSETLKELL